MRTNFRLKTNFMTGSARQNSNIRPPRRVCTVRSTAAQRRAVPAGSRWLGSDGQTRGTNQGLANDGDYAVHREMRPCPSDDDCIEMAVASFEDDKTTVYDRLPGLVLRPRRLHRGLQNASGSARVSTTATTMPSAAARRARAAGAAGDRTASCTVTSRPGTSAWPPWFGLC